MNSMTHIERAGSTFDSYKDKYSTITMSRQDGILEMQFHTEGGPLQWSLVAHNEFESAFLEIGRDRGNEVVIMTGTGEEFCGPAVEPGKHPNRKIMTPETYDPIFWESKQLLPHLLSIEAPVIAAINGPAVRHGAGRRDAHRHAPADGLQPRPLFPVHWAEGRRRGGQGHGLVNEVLSRDKLLDRARELARQILQQPKLVRRYTRIALTEELRGRMHGLLAYGLALEGMARMKS